MTKPNQPVEATDPDAKKEPTPSSSEASVSLIPVWVATRRPWGRERRKDPAAWDRHEEARTGVTPVGYIERRQPPREADRDTADVPSVALVSERVTQLFVGDPVGQRVSFGAGDDSWLTVVGVAGGIRLDEQRIVRRIELDVSAA